MHTMLPNWQRMLRWVLVCGCAALATMPIAAAQDAEPPATAPALQAPAEQAPSRPLPLDTELTTGSAAELTPELSGATLTWFAIVLILALTLHTRPLFTVRNLDALVLAATCLLLAYRWDRGVLAGDPMSLSLQTWASILLGVATLYWLLRGVWLLQARSVPAATPNVSEGSMLVLIAAGLVVSFSHVATAPITAASRDALVGGLCVLETGKLPYGDAAGYDTRSPLLYVAQAGMLRLAPLQAEVSGAPTNVAWHNRSAWMVGDWISTVDPTAVRLLNGLLVILTMAPLVWIGKQLHSLSIGLTMMAAFAVFPGAVECFSRPDIMLPTMLVTWSVAFALLPGIGGLLSVLVISLAGLAWPWCWFGLPVLLGYFLRKGWSGVGAVVGLLGGTAACVLTVVGLTSPMLPRADGSIAAAGAQPSHVAELSAGGSLVIEPSSIPPATVTTDFKSGLWTFLLERESLAAPDAGNVLYRHVSAEGPARDALQKHYRQALAAADDMTRFWTGTRTILEATWLADRPPYALVPGTWQQWSAHFGGDSLWTNVRRGVKILSGLLALLFFVMLVRLAEPRPHQMVGAMLAVAALVLIASPLGPATNWAWLLPLVLTTLAAHGNAAYQVERPGVAPIPVARGGPRITANQ